MGIGKGIVIAIIVVVAVAAAVFVFIKKRKAAKRNRGAVRGVSTVQSAYFSSPQNTQNVTNQQSHPNGSTPGWQSTNYERPTNGINITQPGAYIIPRDPVTYNQTGHPPYPVQNMPYPVQNSPYPVQNPNMVHQVGYEQPPPYNAGFKYPQNNQQMQY